MASRPDSGVPRPRAPARILCTVCGKTLNKQETRRVRSRGLKTFKKCKKGVRSTYSCCPTCCWYLAAEEANRTVDSTIFLEGEGVEKFTGKNLFDLKINCQFCLSLLTDSEKYLNCTNHIPFCLRRQKWRGTCGECLVRENA